MNIGKKIKQLRLRRQMTQNELAGEQVSRNMLSLIENGKAVPSLQTLEAFAERLKVTPAFLLAEREEERVLLKQQTMKDVRLAYSGRNFRIAADLCRKLYDMGMAKDDETDLILAECLFENARESMLAGDVREACRLFDDMVYYATRTVFYTEHLIGAAKLYFSYFNLLSPSLVSEHLDETSVSEVLAFPTGDVFCRYIRAFLTEEEALILMPSDPSYSRLLAAHIRARAKMRGGEAESAMEELSDILRSEDVLPEVLMYHVFGDTEACCKAADRMEKARLYQDLRVSQFEKLMS